MQLSCYIIAKFEKKDFVHEIYSKLNALGHKISYDWTTHKPIKPYAQNQDLARVYGENEIKAIQESDILIAFPDESGSTLFLEIGAGIILNAARGKPKVYIVGELNGKSPWFFSSFVQRRENINQVLAEIGPANPQPL